MKYLLRMSIFAFCTMLFVTSCTKEEVNIQDVENFTNESIDNIQRKCKAGKYGCFEFVWPISIAFEDGTVAEYEDHESLKAGIRAWKEANAEATERPDLVFPLDIMDEEGTLITVNSQEELRAVVQECRDSFGRRGHAREACVRVNYPITIQYPDETTESFDDRRALKTALRAWKEANSDADVRPELVFPIEVTMVATEEVVTVESKEDLQAIKEECRNN